MRLSLRYSLAVLTTLLTCALPPAVAQPASDCPRRLLQTLDGLSFPYSARAFELFAQAMEEALPGLFLAGMNTGGKLGSDWKPGNTYYDEARALIRDAVDKRAGPGGRLVRLDLGAAVSKACETLSEQDVQVVERGFRAPEAPALTRWLDAYLAPILLKDLPALPGFTPEQQAAVTQLNAEADAAFRRAFPDGKKLDNSTDPRIKALGQLLGRTGEGGGKMLGEAAIAPSLADMTLVVRDIKPQLIQIVQRYLASRPKETNT